MILKLGSLPGSITASFLQEKRQMIKNTRYFKPINECVVLKGFFNLLYVNLILQIQIDHYQGLQ